MKFEKILIESAKLSTKDIISTSFDEGTTNPTNPTLPEQGNDPFVADKW